MEIRPNTKWGQQHVSCGSPFAKRDLYNSSKLPCSCQQRPQTPKHCCLALISIVWHSIGKRYPHLEISPSSKEGTTWLMWSSVWKTRFVQLFETSLLLSEKARDSQIMLFGVDSDCLALDWQEYPHLEIRTNSKGGTTCFTWSPLSKRKFPCSCEQRPEVPKQCCLKLIPIAWHSTGKRYQHLEIQPYSKGYHKAHLVQSEGPTVG